MEHVQPIARIQSCLLSSAFFVWCLDRSHTGNMMRVDNSHNLSSQIRCLNPFYQGSKPLFPFTEGRHLFDLLKSFSSHVNMQTIGKGVRFPK